ncbi:KRAB-A domain-containing protein 2-like [Littorina saxatilis]|uniref:KRAB-A domain-containing protein 2-like n=1 Tax=Littorina saxatilis TaxID=31220 RepID=UPI0038B56221
MKTWQELRSNYAWIRHDLVQLFLRTCQECATRATVNKPAVGKPIISLGFLTRVQMDLIDMRTRPDGDFSWIIHLRDHYSKFSWVHPMTSKRAVEVAENVLKTFYLFGAPKILQSDNGKEFVAGVILELVKIWEGMIIINGRPRHPQSQGCAERGNGDVQLKLGKWMEANEDKGWTQGLLHITYATNTSVSETTGKSPYEVVFGQPPRTHCSTL